MRGDGGGGRGEAGRCDGAETESEGRESCWVIVASLSGTAERERVVNQCLIGVL